MVCFSIQFTPSHASCPAHILIMSNSHVCTTAWHTLTSLVRMTHFVHMGSSMSKMWMGEGTCGRVLGHVSRGCGCVAEAQGAWMGDRIHEWVLGHISRGCGCIAEARGAWMGDGTRGEWPGHVAWA